MSVELPTYDGTDISTYSYTQELQGTFDFIAVDSTGVMEAYFVARKAGQAIN